MWLAWTLWGGLDNDRHPVVVDVIVVREFESMFGAVWEDGSVE